jgi:hypothetical protein
MAITFNDLPGIVDQTLRRYYYGAFLDLTSNVQRHPMASRMFGKTEKDGYVNLDFDYAGGTGPAWNALLGNNGSFKMTGLFPQVNPNNTQNVPQATAPWRRGLANTYWDTMIPPDALMRFVVSAMMQSFCFSYPCEDQAHW